MMSKDRKIEDLLERVERLSLELGRKDAEIEELKKKAGGEDVTEKMVTLSLQQNRRWLVEERVRLIKALEARDECVNEHDGEEPHFDCGYCAWRKDFVTHIGRPMTHEEWDADCPAVKHPLMPNVFGEVLSGVAKELGKTPEEVVAVCTRKTPKRPRKEPSGKRIL